MGKKLIMGLLLIVVSLLLDAVSYITDIWLIGFLAGIPWIAGIVLSANAWLSLRQQKQSKNSSKELTQKGGEAEDNSSSLQ